MIGDESLLKIHVHTDRPDQALALGLDFGTLDRVSIDNMDRQIEDVAISFSQQSQSTVLTGEIEGTHAIVSFAQGDGLARALLSVGATTVIQFLRDTPPCIDVILRAVELADSADVLLLPNDSNLLQSAHKIPALTDKRVAIVQSTSFAAGLTALTAMSLTANIDANTQRMTSALADVSTIELGINDKAVTVGKVEISAGSVILYVNGNYTSVAPDLELALTNGFESIGPISPDLCTVFAGRDATVDQRDQVRDRLEQAFPEAEIEVIEGGQAYHRFIVMFE